MTVNPGIAAAMTVLFLMFAALKLVDLCFDLYRWYVIRQRNHPTYRFRRR